MKQLIIESQPYLKKMQGRIVMVAIKNKHIAMSSKDIEALMNEKKITHIDKDCIYTKKYSCKYVIY